MSSFDSAMQILGLLGPERRSLRVGEVCRDLSMPKSSVSRLLRALDEVGLLQREANGGYAAGPRTLTLATLYLDRWPLLSRVDPIMERLVERFGFTGFVSKLDGDDIVLLRVLQGSYPLRYVREVGTRLPAWQTAMGKVLLAGLGEAAILARVAGQPEADRMRLLRTLADVHTTGGIIAGSSFTEGATTVAAFVGGGSHDGAVAIGLAFPDVAVTASLRQEMWTAVLEAARVCWGGAAASGCRSVRR